MNLKITAPILLSFLALGACSDGTDFDFEGNRQAAVDAAPPPDLPFPNTALFAVADGETSDGTLNIPLDDDVDPNDFSNPQVALNTLDGFSTTQPLQAGFDVPLGTTIDPATVILGESVRVFEVNAEPANSFAVTGVISEVVAPAVTVSATADSVVVVPLFPLNQSTSYMVVVTNGVKIDNGTVVDPDVGDLRPSPVNSVYRLVSGMLPLTGDFGPPSPLESLRQATGLMLAAAGTQDIDSGDVINIWTTRTQSITPVMEAVSAMTQPGAIAMQPAGFNTNTVNPAFPGMADIYVGTLDVPYYRTAPSGPNDPVGISSFWRGQGGTFLTAFNTMPMDTSIQTIPVLMTVPNSQTPPPNGWPVAIFVHGITNDRATMLPIADRMAGAGFAVISIDQPMHGITDETSLLSAASDRFANDTERHFNIDLINNETSAPGPDGVVDSSGAHFYSPAQLLASRDNLRQSVADLLVLSASIANITTVPLDANRQSLIGHSLGGTTATTFAAFADNLQSVSLAMPAAGLAPMTIASPTFGPDLVAGLSAAGIEQGTADFDAFVVAAQTVIDSGDPINFGALAASRNQIHMIELIGDNVVPNAVMGAPLAGSQPLARVMGFDPRGIGETLTGSGLVRFNAGNHGSPLLPDASLEAFNEMQTQIATYAATAASAQGPTIVLNDLTVIEIPQP